MRRATSDPEFEERTTPVPPTLSAWMLSVIGYDAEFIGPGELSVPLPVPAQDIRQLDYTHFTVLLDPARRLAAL